MGATVTDSPSSLPHRPHSHHVFTPLSITLSISLLSLSIILNLNHKPRHLSISLTKRRKTRALKRIEPDGSPSTVTRWLCRTRTVLPSLIFLPRRRLKIRVSSCSCSPPSIQVFFILGLGFFLWFFPSSLLNLTFPFISSRLGFRVGLCRSKQVSLRSPFGGLSLDRSLWCLDLEKVTWTHAFSLNFVSTLFLGFLNFNCLG